MYMNTHLAKSRFWQNWKVQSFMRYRTIFKERIWLGNVLWFYKVSSVLFSMYKSMLIAMRWCLYLKSKKKTGSHRHLSFVCWITSMWAPLWVSLTAPSLASAGHSGWAPPPPPPGRPQTSAALSQSHHWGREGSRLERDLSGIIQWNPS